MEILTIGNTAANELRMTSVTDIYTQAMKAKAKDPAATQNDAAASNPGEGGPESAESVEKDVEQPNELPSFVLSKSEPTASAISLPGKPFIGEGPRDERGGAQLTGAGEQYARQGADAGVNRAAGESASPPADNGDIKVPEAGKMALETRQGKAVPGVDVIETEHDPALLSMAVNGKPLAETNLAQPKTGGTAESPLPRAGHESPATTEKRVAQDAGSTLLHRFNSIAGDHSVQVSLANGVLLKPSDRETQANLQAHLLEADGYAVELISDRQRQGQRQQGQQQEDQEDNA